MECALLICTASLMERRRKFICATAVGAVLWAGFVAGGVRVLLNYESAPGPVAAVPNSWPGSRVPLAQDRMTLVMLAHPRCPCTRASVGELARIMADVQGQAVAYVLFAKPANAGADWDDTDLRRSAAAIPGVTTLTDDDGAEALRFGAETSGHTLLFAPDGRLLFNGGITETRGHAGDNDGESAIVALVHRQPVERSQTFVFGCRLPAPGQPTPLTLAER